ncbi:hypothetical protein ABIE64_000173 [Thalassospira sp. MBR-102]|jgi:hypothetical protein|uniref:hypothetical protein n=1 Tax=Thalassospira sp. MBR-102 TaxID=3156466 RepID=UPI0033973DCA
MGAFASYAPMALSALQTGQQISSNRAAQKSRAAETEANRQADIAQINASEMERARERAEELRIRQARLRARQGAAGLQSGGTGSASAVLAGLEKQALSETQAETDAAARRRAEVNRQASWRETSLLRSSQDDTVARLNAWFARRDGW